MNTKTSILLQLGSVENRQDWPDYIQYGFTAKDVPELLTIVTDELLNNLPADDDAVWASLHAWRTLGQLRSPQAIQPLINSFDSIYEDDWALDEIPRVMGMLGEPAIKPLAIYMNESGHDEFARVMAADGLAEVAKQHTQHRDQVVIIFQKYIKSPSIVDGTFNGLLVCQLLDLNAVELIDDIRQLYNKGCVDISCAGDIEEVEILLGLRSKRETPKPDYNKLHSLLPPQPESMNDYFQLIEHYFQQYGHDESILDVSELDGYFSALACSPDIIIPSKWVPFLWGGEFQSPEWQSIEEATQFTEAIMALYNNVMQSFQDNEYEPLFLYNRVEEKEYTVVDEWCNGFLRGLRLWGHMDPDDMQVLEKSLYPIRLFATEEGFDALKSMNHAEIVRQQNTIEPLIQQLHKHFFKLRGKDKNTFVRETPKVGRNDPCPCGSGKKFKRCCLH
ncbi:MAG: UPF0149 family protein [Gammaproteobacteria bacterium]